MKRRTAALVVALALSSISISCLGRYLRLGVDDQEGRDLLRRSRITYADRDGLHLARGDGSDASLLLAASRLGERGAVFLPTLSSDGTRLAFAGLVELDVRDSTGQELSVNILSLSGAAVTEWRQVRMTKIAPPGAGRRYEAFTAAGIAWSPDGDRIAVGLRRPVPAGGDLLVVLDAGGEPVRSFNLGDRKFTRVSGVSWFPDGRALALGLEDPADDTGRGLVARLSLEDGDRTAGAIEPIGPGTFPAISPDGRRIAVIDYRNEMWDIVLLSPGGMEMRRFARPAGRALNRPYWSPDGRYLYYYSLASTGPLGLIEINMLRCLDTRDSHVFDLVRLG